MKKTKQTKEEKEFDKNQPSRGLGDTIEKITEATGIKSLVHTLFGDDCGCEERKKRLNALFKYKTECLTEDEYNTLSTILPTLKSVIDNDTQKILLVIYRRVINPKQEHTSCAGCWSKIISQLRALVREYDAELYNKKE